MLPAANDKPGGASIRTESGVDRTPAAHESAEPLATCPFTPGATPPIAAPGPLPELPGLVLSDELGRGGMGVVYRAQQRTLNRPVAVKMLSTGTWATAEEVARFRAEATAIARLQHPHIVQVYELADYAGQPYFVMEYVGGGTLAARLQSTHYEPHAAATLVETLARAVHVAHEQHVVHRDLKPANILLTVDGTPKIADFGLAKRLDQNSLVTRSDAVLGTPAYMSPEQAAGRAKDVGPATDVYALGAILYHLLTGRPPFLGDTTWETIDQVIRSDVTPPSELAPKVERGLESICLKCLQKSPTTRYTTAASLADDLRCYLDGGAITARPRSWGERMRHWRRRHPWLAKASNGAALLLVICAGLLGLALFGMSVVVSDIQRALRDHPVIREHIGELSRCEYRFADSIDADVFHIVGDRGSGELTVTMESWLSSEIALAVLRLPDGRQWQIIQRGKPVQIEQ